MKIYESSEITVHKLNEIRDEDKKIQGDEEIRCKANKNKTKGMKFANYNKLNDKGVIPENTLLENGDIF